jgi:hypothetical protein
MFFFSNRSHHFQPGLASGFDLQIGGAALPASETADDPVEFIASMD